MNRFPLHLLNRTQRSDFLDENEGNYSCRVHFIEIILNELNGCIEIGLIELVGNVPTQWTEFSSFLNDRVQKGDGVEQRSPFLVRIRFQLLLLSETSECSFETGFDT